MLKNLRKEKHTIIDNICSVGLGDMQLVSKFKEGFRFSMSVIDIYSKYTGVILLKDKKDITINNAFQKFFNELNCKPNKIWLDKGSNFTIDQ